jgi:hypothetical protein
VGGGDQVQRSLHLENGRLQRLAHTAHPFLLGQQGAHGVHADRFLLPS